MKQSIGIVYKEMLIAWLNLQGIKPREQRTLLKHDFFTLERKVHFRDAFERCLNTFAEQLESCQVFLPPDFKAYLMHESTTEYLKDFGPQNHPYDRTFDWVCLGQPVDDLIREKIKIQKGNGKPNTEKVGKITRAELAEIAKAKMDQLNAIDLDGATKIVAGTARSMGVEVVD